MKKNELFVPEAISEAYVGNIYAENTAKIMIKKVPEINRFGSTIPPTTVFYYKRIYIINI